MEPIVSVIQIGAHDLTADKIKDAKWFTKKSTDYANDRNIFGRSIGQNQGVQFPIVFSHIGAGFGKPLLTMHNNTEGTISYTNLICVPSTRPFDLFNPERK